MADKLQTAGTPTRIEGEVQFDAATTSSVLEKRFTGRLTKASTTPSVKNCENWITQNTGAVTVTNFTEGQDGQRLHIVGDGQTTLKHGTKMFMQGGADLLLATNKAYMLLRINGFWYQI